jgi:lactate dehydrogenase-like 2-hydroxyacid dehydrogenase
LGGDAWAHSAARGFGMAIGYHTRAAVAGCPYRYFARLLELATWADCLVAAAPESRTAATALILANLNAHFAGQPLPAPVSLKA